MSVEAQVQPARVSRPYQRDCIDSCARALRETACRVLAIVMPTGAGKTFTVASLLAENGDMFRGVLVVAPQITIAEAWRREIRDAGLSDAHVRVITHAAALNLTAAELGALEGRLLVVDEAHHARDVESDSTGIGAFANYWHAHGGTVLFVTATPFMNGRSSAPSGAVEVAVAVAAHYPRPEDAGRVLWTLRVSNGTVTGGMTPGAVWPEGDHERSCAESACKALQIPAVWVEPIPAPPPRPLVTQGPVRRF